MKPDKNKDNQFESITNKLSIQKEDNFYNSDMAILMPNYNDSKITLKSSNKLTPDIKLTSKRIGAYGTFTVKHDISKYTRAKIFDTIGKQTLLFSRFDLLSCADGFACNEFDPKEFSLKFYSEDGEWDVIGNNMPVLFSNEVAKLDQFNSIPKRDVRTNLKNPTPLWDFFSSNPESLHQVLMLMSERGTPRGYKYMDGFGAHTSSMINKNNERFWVKFHFKTAHGVKTISKEEAFLKRAEDIDYAERDFINSITLEDYPRWTMFIQVMTVEEAKGLDFDPFDVTKTWPKKIFPLIEVGTIELNKIPENYYSEVEQSKFSFTNVIDGVSYPEEEIVKSKLSHYQKSGYQLGEVNEELYLIKGKLINYKIDTIPKNQINEGEESNKLDKQHLPFELIKVTQDSKTNSINDNNDHYSQPGMLFRKVMVETERAHLIFNIVDSMRRIIGPQRDLIINRQLYHFSRVDQQLSLDIAYGLKVNPDCFQTLQ